MNIWFRLGAGFMMTGVALGAFGTHGLRTRLSPDAMQIYQTAVFYHLIHALGLFAVAWSASSVTSCGNGSAGAPKLLRPARVVWFAGWAISLGIVIFAGSLYLLSVTGVRGLGAVTPIGGVCFMAGWAALAFGRVRGS